MTQQIRNAALGRVGVGATLVAKPDSAYSWIGGEADGRGTQVLTRALGIRDLVIGAGVLATVSDSKALRPWLVAGVAADAVDFAATLAGPSAPGRTVVLGVAGGSTLAGLLFLLRS